MITLTHSDLTKLVVELRTAADAVETMARAIEGDGDQTINLPDASRITSLLELFLDTKRDQP